MPSSATSLSCEFVSSDQVNTVCNCCVVAPPISRLAVRSGSPQPGVLWRTHNDHSPEIDLDEEDIPPSLIDRMIVKREDFSGALNEVEPSAMREVLVELPKISWDDVGGLHDAKEQVQESVEWPLNSPERFSRLGIDPPAGVLLYGPPGTRSQHTPQVKEV